MHNTPRRVRLDGLTFEIAGSERREAILQLRGAIYRDELRYPAEAAEWGAADNKALHLIAFAGDVPVGAMRLLGPSSRPFELEGSVDLSPFVRAEHPPGEITRFCVVREFRTITRGLQLQTGLMRLLHEGCRRSEIQDVFICARPSARQLYEFLLFEALTPPNIAYAPLNGALHLLMRLHLPTLPQRYTKSNHLLKAAFAASGDQTFEPSA